MHAFFQNRQRQAQLAMNAGDWFGTPFHPHAAIKGGGVDCVWLAAKIYIACCVITEFNPPPYAMDGGEHNELSQVITWLEKSLRFQKAWQTGADFEPAVGDLLCFRIGRVVHHVGIVLTETTFIHVYRGGNVRESRIDDTTWRKRLVAIYRPIES